MNASVVIIVGLFFIIGIAVGIIAVIALSGRRADRREQPGGPPYYGPDGSDEPREDPDWDSTPHDGPRWPRDTDGYGGS